MAQPMFQFDARMVRDAEKWGRWPLWRRLLKRMMNPERAQQMSNANAAMAYFAPAQPQRAPEPAFWHASQHIKGLF